MECISQGKIRQPYEFGVKVTVVTTHKEGLVASMRSLPGNPYDGQTLTEAIEQITILTNQKPKAVFVIKAIAVSALRGGDLAQWSETRRHTIDQESHSTTKCHRTGNRSHGKRR